MPISHGCVSLLARVCYTCTDHDAATRGKTYTGHTPWRLIIILGNTSPRSCTVNSGDYGVKGDGQAREVRNGVKKDITVATTCSPVLLPWW